jgi:hypothetical protein
VFGKYQLFPPCLRLVISYPIRTLKFHHWQWPIQPFTHEMIKNKHPKTTITRKKIRGEMGEVWTSAHWSIPYIWHFSRTRDQLKSAQEKIISLQNTPLWITSIFSRMQWLFITSIPLIRFWSTRTDVWRINKVVPLQ